LDHPQKDPPHPIRELIKPILTNERKTVAGRVELEEAVDIAKELRQRERYNRIDYYDPYPYQEAFHETGATCNQRLLFGLVPLSFFSLLECHFQRFLLYTDIRRSSIKIFSVPDKNAPQYLNYLILFMDRIIILYLR